MKKYKVKMEKCFFVKAANITEAQAKAVDICASDSEYLMPYNMDITITKSRLPDDYFN
jgi:hypothetical protein